jgi:hypothetical protein
VVDHEADKERPDIKKGPKGAQTLETRARGRGSHPWLVMNRRVYTSSVSMASA